MSIQIASDLHIEVRNNNNPDIKDYITPSANILILAGDIGSLYKISQLKYFLTQATKLFMAVLYIPGNHEYYTIQGYKPTSFQILQKRLENLGNSINKLHILNRSSIRINNTCIVGCTLWSFPTCIIPPFIVKIHNFNTRKYINNHKQDLGYINNMINYCKRHHYNLIVVTHHPPTTKALIGAKKRKQFQSLYATDLEYLLTKDKVKLWICGHTHKNIDLMSPNGCRIVTNQKGKTKDKISDYSKTLSIQLK